MEIAASNIVRSVAGRTREALHRSRGGGGVPAAGGREIQEGGVAQTQKAQTRAVCSGGREPAF